MKAKIIQLVVVDKCEYLLEYHLWSDGRLLLWRRDIMVNGNGLESLGEVTPIDQVLPKKLKSQRDSRLRFKAVKIKKRKK